MADAAVNLDIDGTITVADNFLNGNFALMTKNTADAIVNLEIKLNLNKKIRTSKRVKGIHSCIKKI
jgi:hypothetical protein